ncbi:MULTISPECIES: hypothetical protein [Streptomyces]|uniref:Uncharacterized protein n=1 Tax=Streptomyces viridochromogenes TaxID=1938 RepID=A0A0L8LEK9_STRVR|nr:MULTISPECIES: hypothetical protein [Streptomyces]KOG36555.1 hypothetical protein ADK34_01070 [Streptomyces viridochromogenes]
MSPTRFASEHKWIYWGAIVILVGLAITGVIRYAYVTTNAKTQSKANQLQQELVKAGYPSPDTDTVERLLGTDGGQVCEEPGNALKTALWKIQQSNGAAGPGQRPVISDTRAVEAERIVLQVYCPDELDDFDEALDDLKTDDTVRR